jgi:glycine oxidase
MGQPRRTTYDAVVVGAGLIGLACARRAAERGLSVLVCERAPAPGAGASGVAAGMLAPVTEVDFGEEVALRLNLAARARWPGFAAELACGYRETGALVVAADRDDAEELRRLHELQRSLGLDAQWLAPSRCRELEPGLSPRIAGGILAPQDAQADPRAVVRALAEALAAAGGEVATGVEVEAIETAGGRVQGVRIREAVAGPVEGVRRGESVGGGRKEGVLPGDRFVACEQIVVAAGAWSGALADAQPVRPVKGQILELRVRPGLPEPCERIIRSPRCYVVARGDGRVVLGATVEERGFDTTVTADGVYRLLEAAWEVLPELAELELVGAHAGLRPGTPDNAPIVGRDELDGLVWATGHWRNGVLLAPLTGDAVGGLLAGEELPEELAPLSPRRFACEGSRA